MAFDRIRVSDVKFTDGRMSERNAGSLQSGMSQKDRSSVLKTRQCSEWHETGAGLPPPSDTFPRRLRQECQEGAEQR